MKVLNDTIICESKFRCQFWGTLHVNYASVQLSKSFFADRVDEWQTLAQDRPAWRAATRKGTKHFERSRLQSLDDKRSARKNRVPNPSTAVPCQLCGEICASTFGLQAHICANTSTDTSSSYSKDYYYYYLSLKVLNFWKFTSYCSLKPLWSGMGEVLLARTSPTLHPPYPPTVHQLSWLAL